MNKKRIAALAAAAWMACMPLESGMNAFRLAHAEGNADIRTDGGAGGNADAHADGRAGSNA